MIKKVNKTEKEMIKRIKKINKKEKDMKRYDKKSK
jgi:hypothetical protein